MLGQEDYDQLTIRRLVSHSRHCPPESELQWIVPAMRKFRSQWQGRPTACASTCGLKHHLVHRWLSAGGYPGRESVAAFRHACVVSGIDVPS